MNEYLDYLRDAWQRLVTFVSGRRAPRRRPTPATRRSAGAPGDQATVVATATDGIADIVDRIEATGASEVVLVVPRHARALRDPAAWPHIAAVARRNGLALGVVAARGDVRSHARQNGLLAAASVGSVTRSPHHQLRVGDREFLVPRIAWGGVIRGALLVAGLWVVGLVACNTIPSAEIVIVPASVETTVSSRVRLSPITDTPDLEQTMPVQPATSFRHTFTHTIAIVTSGEVEVPDEPATVVLQFTNETAGDLLVSAGAQIDDENGIGFATDADITVPAAGTATISATAIQAGTTGNVPSDTLILSDDLPRGVAVTNPASADGGTDQLVPAVTEEDVERAFDVEDEVLRRVGARDLAAAVTDGTVFPQTVSVSILTKEPLSNPGDPADTFLVEYTAVVSALMVTEEQAQLTADALILRDLAPGQALLPNSSTATLTETRVEGPTVTALLTATGLVADLIDTTILREAVSGDSPGEAREEIQAMLALESSPQIDLRPGFIPWRWLPRNADRITITYAGPASLLPPADGDTEDGSSDLLTTADATAEATSEGDDATATATAEP